MKTETEVMTLTCNSRKSTGVINNNNDGSVISRASKMCH